MPYSALYSARYLSGSFLPWSFTCGSDLAELVPLPGCHTARCAAGIDQLHRLGHSRHAVQRQFQVFGAYCLAQVNEVILLLVHIVRSSLDGVGHRIQQISLPMTYDWAGGVFDCGAGISQQDANLGVRNSASVAVSGRPSFRAINLFHLAVNFKFSCVRQSSRLRPLNLSPSNLARLSRKPPSTETFACKIHDYDARCGLSWWCKGKCRESVFSSTLRMILLQDFNISQKLKDTIKS